MQGTVGQPWEAPQPRHSVREAEPLLAVAGQSLGHLQMSRARCFPCACNNAVQEGPELPDESCWFSLLPCQPQGDLCRAEPPQQLPGGRWSHQGKDDVTSSASAAEAEPVCASCAASLSHLPPALRFPPNLQVLPGARCGSWVAPSHSCPIATRSAPGLGAVRVVGDLSRHGDDAVPPHQSTFRAVQVGASLVLGVSGAERLPRKVVSKRCGVILPSSFFIFSPGQMLETDAERPGQMHSEDGKVAAGDAPPAAEAPAPAESWDALGATQRPFLVEKQPGATEKGEEQPSSLPAFVIPELRLDSTFSQSAVGIVGSNTDGEDEEDDDEEDEDEEDEDEDSDEHYLERNEVKRSSMIETSGCQPVYTLSVQSSLRRRTHSEGSLLQEAKSHCFTSDTTLNCSDSQGTKGHWALPSPRTLKKELAKNGGSIHQLTLLFSGHRKVCEPMLALWGSWILLVCGNGGVPGVGVCQHVAPLSMAMAKLAPEGLGRSLPLAVSSGRCLAPRGCHPEPVCWCCGWASPTTASRSCKVPCLGELLSAETSGG